MTRSEEYRRYAADCNHMVNYTRDPESKAIWKQMAARWQNAAEAEEEHGAQEHSQTPLRHGESSLRWD
jgi:hypothetical protein